MKADEPITAEWLSSVGIYQSDAGKNSPDHPPTEFGARIRGGTDDGLKTSSDQDADGDEIADLVVALAPGENWVSVYVETYALPSLNTVAIVELGVRHSRQEILDLCRALKAWAITYPPDAKEPDSA